MPADGCFWVLFWGMLGLLGVNLVLLPYNGHKIRFAAFLGPLGAPLGARFAGPLGQGSGKRLHSLPRGEAVSVPADGSFLGHFLGYAGASGDPYGFCGVKWAQNPVYRLFRAFGGALGRPVCRPSGAGVWEAHALPPLGGPSFGAC